ncbi:MAG: hypothetical protein ACW981_07320 [Candidatus Hodarchaeales archaeon]|jgi:hypothetical protein
MTCPAYDTEKKFCNHLQMKFYEGMERPCESVPEPAKCPIVLMREG